MTTEKNTASVENPLFDELLCVADSKFILGNWYMIALPNGRSVSDWTALSAMLQEHYGHARALYRFFSRFGFTREQAEWQRPASDIRSARLLDLPPNSWEDFVVTAHIAELAFSHRLNAFAANHADPQLARLTQKIVKETAFHLMYWEGWAQVLQHEQAAAVSKALTERLPILLEWWDPDDDHADALAQAGLRSLSDSALRLAFQQDLARIYAATMPSSPFVPSTLGPWSTSTRRTGPAGIPHRLHERIRFKEPELAVP